MFATISRFSIRKSVFVLPLVLGLCSFSLAFFACQTESAGKQLYLDGGCSPGTYEPDPDNQRRPDDHGGPYNEPGSDDDRRGGGDHGGPYNEPGSDGGPY